MENPVQPETLLQWFDTIGTLLLSWPLVVLIVILLFYRPIKRMVDQFTRGDRVESIEIGSFKLRRKLNELAGEVKEQEQRIEEQQEIINKLVLYSLSASNYLHLWHIGKSKEYNYRNERWFQRQMDFLNDNGLIQPRSTPFLSFGPDLDGRNLVEVAKLTPIGEFLVQLRGEPPELRRST